MSLTLKPIAIVESCFKEKFGIPHQGGQTPSAPAKLHICSGYQDPAFFDGIENFKYLWLLFGFHDLKNKNEEIKKVRPPRLGGQKKVGVFATRSPYRPNPIGMSVVEFVKMESVLHGPSQKLILHIKNHDLLEGTPIYDIKPYHPEADRLMDANLGWIDQAKFQEFDVHFSDEIDQSQWGEEKELKQQVVREMLSRDIRSLHNKINDKDYGVRVFDQNIRFRILEDNSVQVFEIKRFF